MSGTNVVDCIILPDGDEFYVYFMTEGGVRFMKMKRTWMVGRRVGVDTLEGTTQIKLDNILCTDHRILKHFGGNAPPAYRIEPVLKEGTEEAMFSQSETVYLNSGGPKMTVCSVDTNGDEDGPSVTVVWFNNVGETVTDSFPAVCLTRIDPDAD